MVFDSPFAEFLPQMDVTKEIPYEGWTCEEPGCDRVENLWMNLSDGVVMCGRYGRSSSANQPNLLWDCATGSLSIGQFKPHKYLVRVLRSG